MATQTYTRDGGRTATSWTNSGPVTGPVPGRDLRLLQQRNKAMTGDSSTLGLWGFATGTWIAGVVLAGVYPVKTIAAAAPILLVFAGLGQFIAGLYAFRRSNAVAGTAFCSYGSFNVIASFIFLLQAMGLFPLAGSAEIIQGYLLLSFGFISFVLMSAGMAANWTLVSVLGVLGVGYTLTGIAFVSGNAFHSGALGEVGYVGGYALIASAGLAYYLGIAHVVNSGLRRKVIPIFGEA